MAPHDAAHVAWANSHRLLSKNRGLSAMQKERQSVGCGAREQSQSQCFCRCKNLLDVISRSGLKYTIDQKHFNQARYFARLRWKVKVQACARYFSCVCVACMGCHHQLGSEFGAHGRSGRLLSAFDYKA